MTPNIKEPQLLKLNIISNISNLAIVLGVVIGALSLSLIAIQLSPVSRQAKSWNVCVNRTGRYLSTLPGFSSVGSDGLEAMSVSLCNGSTPQREKGSSESE